MRDKPRPARRPPSAPLARRGGPSTWLLQLAFVAAHVPLAMAIPRRSPLLGFHALLVLGLGLIAAVIPRKQHLAAYAAAYITGAAVFWRMRAAPIPWEFGKYAIVVIFFAALVVTVGVRRPFLPIAYFALLVPSAFLTVTSTPWPVAREMLSFNLSGPLALAMSVLFFSSVALSPARMQWLLVCLLAPVVGTATVAATGLKAALRSAEFEYGATSSVAASGGFGPNQVSAILGFGIVAILVFFVLGRASRVVMGAMLLVMLFLAAQCLLTLSRGGIYMAMGAVGAASFYLMRERRSRLRVLLAGAVVGAIFVLIVIPRLEGLTGGVVVSRFGNTSGTGRELLVLADLKTWSENPVLGIGPGLGGPNRLKYFSVGSAHTEYTRLLAEHGLLGLISLGLLGAMAVRNFRSQRTTRGRAISAALLAYALLFMVVDAMRLGAPAFAFGLSGVTVVAARRRRLTQAEPRRIPVPGAARAS